MFLRFLVFIISEFISFTPVLLSRKLKKGKMGKDLKSKKNLFLTNEIKGGRGLKCLVRFKRFFSFV